MSTEYLIAWWEELLYAFVLVLAVADICMILFIGGLAVIERILRRELLHEPTTLKDVARQVAEIRREQADGRLPCR